MKRLLQAFLVVSVISCFFLPARANASACGRDVSRALCRDIRTDLRDIFQDESRLDFLLLHPRRNAAKIEKDLDNLDTAIFDLEEAIASASV
jgi:hypothetical protein